MAEFNLGTGQDINIGNALAGIDRPIEPKEVSLMDRLMFGAKQATSEENIGSTAYAINQLGKMLGADPSISGPVGELSKSTIAAQAAKKQKLEQSEMFNQLISALSGGGPTPKGTGGFTDLKISGGDDGAVTGTLTGDLATPTKEAPSVTQDDLLAGGTLRDLIPF